VGEKRGLTADAVIDAAAAIADEEGLAAASLATVAARLKIRSPSLYHYFDGTAGLRRALALRSAEELANVMHDAVAARNGGAALRALARAYRLFARSHPGLYAALLPAPKPGEDDALYSALARPVAIVAAVLTELGVPPRRTVPTIRALRSFLHGFVTLERDGGFGMPDDVDASFDAGVEHFLRALTPP
jgi:AcrR family transcriptional regulator